MTEGGGFLVVESGGWKGACGRPWTKERGSRMAAEGGDLDRGKKQLDSVVSHTSSSSRRRNGFSSLVFLLVSSCFWDLASDLSSQEVATLQLPLTLLLSDWDK